MYTPPQSTESNRGSISNQRRETHHDDQSNEQGGAKGLCSEPDGKLGGGIKHGLGSNVDNDSQDEELDAEHKVEDVSLLCRQCEEGVPCSVEVGTGLKIRSADVGRVAGWTWTGRSGVAPQRCISRSMRVRGRHGDESIEESVC